jgi:hypothetical protein
MDLSPAGIAQLAVEENPSMIVHDRPIEFYKILQDSIAQ